MSPISLQQLRLDKPAVYQIRVYGYLDETWSQKMGGLSILATRQPGGDVVTVLTGSVRDQSALAGTLHLLFDLGFPLLSVECLGADPA